FTLGSTAPATPTPFSHSVLNSYLSLKPHLIHTILHPEQPRNLNDLENSKTKTCHPTEKVSTCGFAVPGEARQYTSRQTKRYISIWFNVALWTLGDFLYYTFRTKDEHWINIHRGMVQHSKYSQNLLQGTKIQGFEFFNSCVQIQYLRSNNC
ncbi:hypothetical protein K443DRAFT_96282, partial [Laccaria amethystina LaAM-08-1]